MMWIACYVSIKTKVRAFVIRLLSEDDAELLYPSIILSHFAIATDHIFLIIQLIRGRFVVRGD